MKRKVLFCLLCAVISLPGCAGSLTSGYVLTKNLPVNLYEKENIENHFFFGSEQRISYTSEFTFSSADYLPDKVVLAVTELLSFDNGVLYEMKIDYNIDFPGRIDYEWDRFHLGYFYVLNDKIYMLRGDHILDEIKSEDYIVSNGELVCQNEELADPNADVKGMHKYILVNGDRREYHSYNDLTETGFYETFIWQSDVGLVNYRSGYGAAKDGIVLLIDQENLEK